ncbi:MBL fold metallo-hydrolase [Novosphingobium sp.]|uniref:MBL fold metallo-hydrolase n=1 Tax=Novosphingobium sp. TaxID=1874826 RepID=UPI00286B47BE|nr:MBL fold metallo-hydrolase [Novosphingobium sp.]
MAAPGDPPGAVGAIQPPYHHRQGGGFRNPEGSPVSRARLRDFLKFLLWDMRRAKLPPLPPGLATAIAPDLSAMQENEVTWLGHACFALRIGGKLVLTDPYLGKAAGPFGLGPRRFLPPAITAADLPQLDLIVISHNHYDHVDGAALGAYRWRAQTPVVCPLGLAPLLRRQGFTRITEIDWWQDWRCGALTVTALPAVHFSGRGPFDRNRTLWASMALAGPHRKVWFGGDTGYGACFREIGERAGPFDLALVGIGAYEPRIIMEASHATPEEAIMIARDIRARTAVGMHWGSIMLTPEDPFEAPARFRRAALEQQYGEENAWIMQVGEVRGF